MVSAPTRRWQMGGSPGFDSVCGTVSRTLRISLVCLVLAPLVVLVSARAATAAPGDPSVISPYNSGVSCSVSTTAASGVNFATQPAGWEYDFWGQCSFPTDDPHRGSEFGALLLSGTLPTEIRLCPASAGTTCSSSDDIFIVNQLGNFSAYNKFTGWETEPCEGVTNCVLYRFTVSKGSNNPSQVIPAEGTKVFLHVNYSSSIYASLASECTNTATCTVHVANDELDTSEGIFEPPNPSYYYWTDPYVVVEPVYACGTDGDSGNVGSETPIPVAGWLGASAQNPSTLIQPGSATLVYHPDVVANGQVYARWADSDRWVALRDDVDGVGQSARLERSASDDPAMLRTVVFRCTHADVEGALYSMFIVPTGGPYSEGMWPAFVYTATEALRPCSGITLVDVPVEGLHPLNDPYTLTYVSASDRAAGDIRLAWSWNGQAGSIPSQALTASVEYTYDVPAAPFDRDFKHLMVTCEDPIGRLTTRGQIASEDVEAGSTDLFPNSKSLASCLYGPDLNPSSWAPALIDMGACVLHRLFVPSEMDMDALQRRLMSDAGESWLSPLTAITDGVATLAATSGDCDYSVELPINGGLGVSFNSCSGPVAQGRQIVYTMSSLAVIMFAALWLRRRAIAVLTLNAEEAARSGGRH